MELEQAVSTEPVNRARRNLALVALALFITLLNATKPLAVDDSVYYLFANHIADHPFDPYGFKAWNIQEANSILAPPGFLYYWALEIRLLGQEPLAWKLGLLPINLLWVFTLYALGRRFASERELLFVCFVTLSGVVLPCINMMLDIPSLALSLWAVVLFLRACDRNSLLTATIAGLVAGVAIQTKYTAFVAPAIMFVYGVFSGRWRLGLLASVLSGLVFVGWEMLIAWRYGQSHFWLGYTQFRAPLTAKFKLVQPLFGYLGSAGAAGLPFLLAGLGRSSRIVWAFVGLITLLFALVCLPSNAAFVWLSDTLRLSPTPKLTGVLFGIIGVVQLMGLALVARRLVRQRPTEGSPVPRWRFSTDTFLVCWLFLEIAGYFALSPFPATRRIMGIVVIGTLLVCRLAARTNNHAKRMWGIVAFNFALGLLMFVIDDDRYRGYAVMADELAQECRHAGEPTTIWYVANGTFEFYGDRAGLKLLPSHNAVVSSGDWVLVADGFEARFMQHPIFARCTFERIREWPPSLPVRSQFQYGNVALVRQPEPSAKIVVWRVQ